MQVEDSTYQLPPDIWNRIVKYVVEEQSQEVLDKHRSDLPKKQYRDSLLNFRGINKYTQKYVDRLILRNSTMFAFGLFKYVTDPFCLLTSVKDSIDQHTYDLIHEKINDNIRRLSCIKLRTMVSECLCRNGVDTRCMIDISDPVVKQWLKSQATNCFRDVTFKDIVDMLNGLCITTFYNKISMCCLTSKYVLSVVGFKLSRCVCCGGHGRDKNYEQLNGGPLCLHSRYEYSRCTSLNCTSLSRIALHNVQCTSEYRKYIQKMSELEKVQHDNEISAVAYNNIVKTFFSDWCCYVCYLMYRKPTLDNYVSELDNCERPFEKFMFYDTLIKNIRKYENNPHELLYNGNSGVDYSFMGGIHVQNDHMKFEDYKKVTKHKCYAETMCKRKLNVNIKGALWTNSKKARKDDSRRLGKSTVSTSWKSEGCCIAVAHSPRIRYLYTFERLKRANNFKNV